MREIRIEKCVYRRKKPSKRPAYANSDRNSESLYAVIVPVARVIHTRTHLRTLIIGFKRLTGISWSSPWAFETAQEGGVGERERGGEDLFPARLA